MIPTLRWFGPSDPITLSDIRAAGAHGVVTALHSVPNGQAWSRAAIDRRLAEIESDGISESGHPLTWSVVESVPVHESIKQGRPEAEQHALAFAKTLTNLGRAGITTVCYNFMPVLDWTRTDLAYPLPNGTQTLRFSQTEFDAFALFELESDRVRESLPQTRIDAAAEWHVAQSPESLTQLRTAVCSGLPGSEESYSISDLRERLDRYADISEADLLRNLHEFLQQVVPAAEAANVRLALHPDDPPWGLLGLPRIASCAEHYRKIFSALPSLNNGMTFCSGSFAAIAANDLSAIVAEFAQRIHFVHLRNVARERNETFHETAHLSGSVDMPTLLRLIKKASEGRETPLHYRPDHGAATPADRLRESRPGYPYVGRLRGLAELRGVLAGLEGTAVDV